MILPSHGGTYSATRMSSNKIMARKTRAVFWPFCRAMMERAWDGCGQARKETPKGSERTAMSGGREMDARGALDASAMSDGESVPFVDGEVGS